MEKIVEIAVLFDYYGKLLSEKQYKVVDQYCNEDLSLREIAELNGISKQGISDILSRAEKKLRFYEDELKLISKFEKINSSLREISLLIEKSKIEDSSLQSILDIIQKKNNEIIENDL
ncbi:sigma factor-like helix-turn-helix DNA-binding protein [Parvimonas micra]|uniref:YlxM family DNA-binding protein n=1 Tax=Parvimonas TaxID=543311 RepID=UPI00020DCBA4|nr:MULTISPECIES: sigma factor-like helix-turn-helix DNA-binding protein [unclassified Parvimonas]EGL38751.1 helix-turn-helix protein, YlxM/p13 family [Parvimonas sp. oral taxon 110 str. F0139]MEB3011457.1 sigma factor-like helix-turn-helix DNA-binding protein [Parvimonas sp. D2]MEB3086949.1 sigma factor-like helix-turn-helix DNA-binding protein [Parvimonas sp. D4]